MDNAYNSPKYDTSLFYCIKVNKLEALFVFEEAKKLRLNHVT